MSVASKWVRKYHLNDADLLRAITDFAYHWSPPELWWEHYVGKEIGLAVAIGPPVIDWGRDGGYSVVIVFQDGSASAFHPFSVYPVVQEPEWEPEERTEAEQLSLL